LLTELPALKNPTISPLADDTWVSVNTVVEKDCLIELLPKIRKIAQGLVVYEPRQVLALDEIARRKEGQCKKGISKSLGFKAATPDWFKRQQADKKLLKLENNVKAIMLIKLKAEGDKALLEFAFKFDKAKLTHQPSKSTPEEIKEAYKKVSKEQISALEFMKQRVSVFQKQLLTNRN
jgi:hypothetical protein